MSNNVSNHVIYFTCNKLFPSQIEIYIANNKIHQIQFNVWSRVIDSPRFKNIAAFKNWQNMQMHEVNYGKHIWQKFESENSFIILQDTMPQHSIRFYVEHFWKLAKVFVHNLFQHRTIFCHQILKNENLETYENRIFLVIKNVQGMSSTKFFQTNKRCKSSLLGSHIPINFSL